MDNPPLSLKRTRSNGLGRVGPSHDERTLFLLDYVCAIAHYVCVFMRYMLFRTAEFNEWLAAQSESTRRQIEARLLRLSGDGHFGTVHRFGEITELKWKSGLRVYTTVRNPKVIVLLGGNKNGQDKDIRKAKKILGEIDRA